MTKTETQASSDARRRIALITNHGYAGVDIPVGGAPDTGGQNFYVNSLATALGDMGMEVTIFARGGFPFFGSDRLREGTELLNDRVRYVYVPGGPGEFLRKEDIAIALDEEVEWLARFICDEARAEGIDPWKYYDCINTHYWDAAVMGFKLVERWQDQAAMNFLSVVSEGKLAGQLDRFEGEARHRLGLSRELAYHLGRMTRDAFPDHPPRAAAEMILERHNIPQGAFEPPPGTAQAYTDIERTRLLGEHLAAHLRHDGVYLGDFLSDVDRHVWTPHSIGIIKERNYWDKAPEQIRPLKFRERTAHEEAICSRTRRFCSTSPEIWRSLVSYHGVEADAVFDFPPCIDGETFRRRSEKEMEAAYAYLAEKSGIDADRLKASRIVFETSRMDRTKRKDLLLTAFASVARDVEDAYLFIGGGPESSPVFKELEAHKETMPSLEGRAFLLGFIPEEVLEPLFSVPDVFATASEMEGFGMSASQAAAAGVAVIASDLIPFATQYAPDAALVFEAGNADAMADAIRRLLTDDEERARRAAALEEIAARLNWHQTAARFLEWFEASL